MDNVETRAVWLAACVTIWESLELIYECVHAHADVLSTTADFELAYIVDTHHDGKLALHLHPLIDWVADHEHKIRRSRNGGRIIIGVEPSE